MNTIQDLYQTKINSGSSTAENKLKNLKSSAAFDNAVSEALTGTKKNVMNKQQKKLWDTCVEAESLFVNKMLKEMRKGVEKGEWLHGGFAEEIFEDMLYDEYSLQVSKNSNLGMAKMLYNELSRRI
ncbi:MAG TPA: rod-binding protein [Spirochaetota bacterium]|nr:rod-binding protein [Spirochaetota bacterium]HPF06314.1 rod-binding protein [Spirochaetota bacterium]HPJ40912.1 rod-binding protein [Spirochaetota bacterium]HPR37740.1 rod-binding protein [Spirochaetota bacterium]HRX47753.1 rod-binding protein [Spirochaetota bacterium]